MDEKKIEAAEAALHKAMVEKFGAAYLLARLEVMLAEHRKRHHHEVAAPRRPDRPGRYQIHEIT